MAKLKFYFYRSLPLLLIVVLGGVVVFRSQARSEVVIEPVSSSVVSAQLAGANQYRHQFTAQPVVTEPTVVVTPQPTATVDQQEEVAAPVAIDVTLVIQSPKQKQRWSFQVLENSSVDAMMRWASAQYQFSYVTKQFSGLGAFVEELAGVKSNDQAGLYWLYEVNGTVAAKGVSSLILHDGDTITWKYAN